MAKRKKSSKKQASPPSPTNAVDQVYRRVLTILAEARFRTARTVNAEMVRAYWLVGREIVEEEQRGRARASYGQELIKRLSARLQTEFGEGFTPTNLKYMRLFYLAYPELLREAPQIGHAVRDQSAEPVAGRLNPDLSWTHYRLLTKLDSPEVRGFYEIEAARNCWSSRELDRQINSLLFERLAKSRDKKGLLRLATKGQEIQAPEDIFKDTVVIEFLGLPQSHRLTETDLEEALISNLQAFLLELGRGFAFVARQKRITLDRDHFYVDLVFYHVILKCYVLLDLKVGKLTHEDLGQIQLYVNYYDETQRTGSDGPTVGLILCADKNDLMVKYTLGQGNQQIFASRYKLHLPTPQELAAELDRERRTLDLDRRLSEGEDDR
jgi:predicted nuclease of restriction endonuclease-like (RecB) superfamily